MTDHTERIELVEDLIRNGVGPGMTLRQALEVCERLIVEASTEPGETVVRTAARLGMTREGYYLAKKRLGIPVPSATKPVPADWRERLAANG